MSNSNYHFRYPVHSDKQNMLLLADSVGLFEPDELSDLGEIMDAYFEGQLGENHHWLLVEEEKNQAKAVAYFAPEPFTYGVTNLYFIAVHPDHHRSGWGEIMLKYIEKFLADKGQRILLVETSGLPALEKARHFYQKQGFTEEARIREYYKEGDDKIIYWKKLG